MEKGIVLSRNESRGNFESKPVYEKTKETPPSEADSSDSARNSPSLLKRISFHSSISSFFDRTIKRASKWLGLLFAAASGLLLTLYSALYKLVKNDIDNSTVLMLRSVIQVLTMVIILTIRRKNVTPSNMENKTTCQKSKVWIIFLLVCLFGGFRLCFIFGALEKIPMALVHTILNGSPVVVMVLGHFFLKDPCNLLRTFCTFGLVAGVILIFQPQTLIGNAPTPNSGVNNTFLNGSEFGGNFSSNCSDNSTDCVDSATKLSNDLIGYGFSLGALFLSAFGSVLTKKITRHFDKMVIALYLGISIGAVGWLQLMIFEPKAPTVPNTAYPWIIATIVGFLGVAQQFCLIAALKLESPTRVTVVRSLQIVVSFIVQVQAWNELPGFDQIIGTVIVVSAICIVTLEDPIYRKIHACKKDKGCYCCGDEDMIEPEPVKVFTEKP